MGAPVIFGASEIVISASDAREVRGNCGLDAAGKFLHLFGQIAIDQAGRLVRLHDVGGRPKIRVEEDTPGSVIVLRVCAVFSFRHCLGLVPAQFRNAREKMAGSAKPRLAAILETGRLVLSSRWRASA